VTGETAVGVRFDRSLLERLDAETTLFSPGEQFELLSTLRLTLAGDGETAPRVDPVAAADAAVGAGRDDDGGGAETSRTTRRERGASVGSTTGRTGAVADPSSLAACGTCLG
jgi:hypothetical protein